MYCAKCGLLLGSNETQCSHCSPSQLKVFKPIYNFKVPPVPSMSSPSFERTTLALTPNAPAHLTIEEILSAKASTLGVFGMLRSIVTTWKEIFKKPSPTNIVILAMGAIMLILWVWTKYIPGPYRMMSRGGIASVLATLTASFNNVPARVLHFSALVTLGIAFLPPLIKGDISPLTNNVKGSFGLVRKILSYKKSKSLYSVIIASGVGMFFANYLMRNCSMNKYFVCLTLGVTVIFSSSGLFNSTFIKLCAGIYNDITKLLKIHTKLTKYQTSLKLGLGFGLILSIVPCFMRRVRSTNFTDHSAYILGIVIVVVGIFLTLSADKKSSVTP